MCFDVFSSQFHVFELTRQLPRFAMYGLVAADIPDPKSSVTFQINERINRVVMWINQNFLLQEDITADGSTFNITFVSLRGSGPIKIKMEQGGQVVILFYVKPVDHCMNL